MAKEKNEENDTEDVPLNFIWPKNLNFDDPFPTDYQPDDAIIDNEQPWIKTSNS